MSATDIGLVRKENQDTVRTAVFDDGILAVVCDGMGGARAGREASQLAVDTVVTAFSDGFKGGMSPPELRKLMLGAVAAANTAVYQKSYSDAETYGMGTTCVMAFAEADRLHVVNVGDSRAYLMTDTLPLTQLTLDHTATEMLFAQGRITREEMKNHPQRHMLTKVIGVERRVTPDYFIEALPKCFHILLCSDGLYGLCSDEEIAALVREKPLDSVCDVLIALAKERGGRDNITVALITGEDSDSK